MPADSCFSRSGGQGGRTFPRIGIPMASSKPPRIVVNAVPILDRQARSLFPPPATSVWKGVNVSGRVGLLCRCVILGWVCAALETALLGCCSILQASNIPIVIETVTVGDPGNKADYNGYGTVSESYQMGKYDVTTSQFTAFLNSVAKSADPYGLYNPKMATDFPTVGITRTSGSAGFSYAVKGNGNVPVFDVSWGDSVRFVNWLQNGQPTGAEGPATTEAGSYTLTGTSDASLLAVTRTPGATWVLPTRDYWYKAAYYKTGGTNAGYWAYPTQSDTQPSNLLSSTGTNNANYADINQGGFTDHVNFLTPVGAFAASPGPYGTFDQGGDITQWNETLVTASARSVYGGSFTDIFTGLYSASINGSNPSLEGAECGFRVAVVPEPNTITLLLVAASSVIACRSRIGCMKI